MERILSEEEIDALLKAAQDVKSEAGADGPARLRSGEATPFDLTSQGKPVRGPLPSLDRVDDRFSRGLRSSLMGVLRRRIEGSPRGRAFVKQEELLASLPSPSCIALCRIESLQTSGMLVFDPTLVYAILDAFFGAKEVSDDHGELRELTAIEQRIMARVTRVLLEDLGRAWEPVQPLRAELVRIEQNPQFVTHLPPHAVVVDTELGLDIDGKQAHLRVVLPYAALEPLKERLQSGVIGDPAHEGMRARVWGRMKETPVTVSAELGHAGLSVRELLALRPGDVVMLESGQGQRATVLIEGTRKGVGQPVVSRGSYAVRLDRLTTRGAS